MKHISGGKGSEAHINTKEHWYNQCTRRQKTLNEGLRKDSGKIWNLNYTLNSKDFLMGRGKWDN